MYLGAPYRLRMEEIVCYSLPAKPIFLVHFMTLYNTIYPCFCQDTLPFLSPTYLGILPPTFTIRIYCYRGQDYEARFPTS